MEAFINSLAVSFPQSTKPLTPSGERERGRERERGGGREGERERKERRGGREKGGGERV